MKKLLTTAVFTLMASSVLAGSFGNDFVRPMEDKSVDHVVHSEGFQENGWYYTDWFKATYEGAKRDLWLIDIGYNDSTEGDHYWLDDWQLQHAAAYVVAWCHVVDREAYDVCFDGAEMALVKGVTKLKASDGSGYYWQAEDNWGTTTVDDMYSIYENQDTMRFKHHQLTDIHTLDTYDHSPWTLAEEGHSYNNGAWEQKDGR